MSRTDSSDPTWLRRGRPVALAVLVAAAVIAGGAPASGAAPEASAPRDLGVVTAVAGEPLRVVVIGDFGHQEGRGPQRVVFEAVKARHRRPGQAYHLGLTVGDNFYPCGVRSRADLERRWAATGYPTLQIPFYAALGNHDHCGQVDAQRVAAASTWLMPFTYYTFAAGPARFFAIDTDEGTTRWFDPLHLFGLVPRPWSDAQRDWLRGALAAHAGAAWKIVYGHHPIHSDGKHGPTKRLLAPEGLADVLRRQRVDLYLAGHDHDLQHHVPGPQDAGIHFVVAGGGGREAGRIRRRHAAFAAGVYGFAELEIDERTLAFRLVGADGQVLHAPAPLTK